MNDLRLAVRALLAAPIVTTSRCCPSPSASAPTRRSLPGGRAADPLPAPVRHVDERTEGTSSLSRRANEPGGAEWPAAASATACVGASAVVGIGLTIDRTTVAVGGAAADMVRCDPEAAPEPEFLRARLSPERRRSGWGQSCWLGNG